MLELDWPYKRHAGVFAGTQQYAQEQGWESVIDEYAAWPPGHARCNATFRKI